MRARLFQAPPGTASVGGQKRASVGPAFRSFLRAVSFPEGRERNGASQVLNRLLLRDFHSRTTGALPSIAPDYQNGREGSKSATKGLCGGVGGTDSVSRIVL